MRQREHILHHIFSPILLISGRIRIQTSITVLELPILIFFSVEQEHVDYLILIQIYTIEILGKLYYFFCLFWLTMLLFFILLVKEKNKHVNTQCCFPFYSCASVSNIYSIESLFERQHSPYQVHNHVFLTYKTCFTLGFLTWTIFVEILLEMETLSSSQLRIFVFCIFIHLCFYDVCSSSSSADTDTSDSRMINLPFQLSSFY